MAEQDLGSLRKAVGIHGQAFRDISYLETGYVLLGLPIASESRSQSTYQG